MVSLSDRPQNKLFGQHVKKCTKERSYSLREEYAKNPKICILCESPIDFDKKINKFCSQSCSASYNNKGVRRHGKPANECLTCGKKTSCSGHKYCSSQCFGASRYLGQERKKQQNAACQSRYRAKEYKSLDPHANKEKIDEIYKNRPEGYEVDHIIPLSKGGRHHEDNLQYLTRYENRKKKDKI